jgi:hypothetical protein
MGISTVPMFSMVQLGEHEEKLRLMVLNEQPADWRLYPCFLTGLTLDGKFYPDWMLQPDIVTNENGKTCRVVIGGILYFFFLNAEPIPDGWRPFTLNPNGTFLLRVQAAETIPYLHADLMRQSENILRHAKDEGK